METASVAHYVLLTKKTAKGPFSSPPGHLKINVQTLAPRCFNGLFVLTSLLSLLLSPGGSVSM